MASIGRSRRDAYGPEPEPWDVYLGLAPWVIALVLGLYLAFDSFYTVAPHEQAVVMQFGKYRATTQPGLQFKLPLATQVIKVSVEEHGLRLPFSRSDDEASARVGRPDEDLTLMLNGDLNAASVEWTVQWRVTDPAEYVFRFPQVDNDRFAEDLVATVSLTVMNRLVGDYSFDEVIGPKRSDIAHQARQDTQRILDSYQCGITVTALQMQRVIPPERVKPAFDRVNASIQEKQRLENEAEAARNSLLPAARAEKDKLIREAEGYSGRRMAEAQGEIDALLVKYQAYRTAPDVTRRRLYLEAMAEVLSGIPTKTIIDSEMKQVLPLLPLGGGAQP
jgi:membrane protease subunit HflK